MPRISVLLPCHNHGAWIEEAVRSVLDQTCQDFEIIVVDDGSDDPATRERLDALRAPRTRLLRTANRGLPAARNHAARHAAGELFCALDADDRLAPAWFEKGLAVLDERPQVAFVSQWLQTFGDEHWTWTPERQADLFIRAFEGLGIERPVVVGHSWGTLVALALALDHPQRVRGLVLLAGYYYPTKRPDVVVFSAPSIPVLGDIMRYTHRR